MADNGQVKVRKRSGKGQAKVRQRSGKGQVKVMVKVRQRSSKGQAKVRQRSGKGQAKVRQRSGQGQMHLQMYLPPTRIGKFFQNIDFSEGRFELADVPLPQKWKSWILGQGDILVLADVLPPHQDWKIFFYGRFYLTQYGQTVLADVCPPPPEKKMKFMFLEYVQLLMIGKVI